MTGREGESLRVRPVSLVAAKEGMLILSAVSEVNSAKHVVDETGRPLGRAESLMQPRPIIDAGVAGNGWTVRIKDHYPGLRLGRNCDGCLNRLCVRTAVRKKPKS